MKKVSRVYVCLCEKTNILLVYQKKNHETTFFLTAAHKMTENALAFFLFWIYPLKRFRKNDEIRLPEVFLVDDTGEKIGNISTEKAKILATKKGLDLVEVSPNMRPPVCRMMDFGTFLFEQKKKDKLQRKSKKAVETKGIRFGIRISQHDFEVKARAARKFLEKGHPVKATLQFRGREIVHDELGFAKMTEFKDVLADISRVDQTPRKQGRQITMMLVPQKNTVKKQAKSDE